jgi:RHS repeat-associated protein
MKYSLAFILFYLFSYLSASEPNETFVTATAININTIYYDSISPTGDIDYYKFNAIAGYGYTPRIESNTGVTVVIYVYDQLQNQLYGGGTQFNYTCSTSGINYLKIIRSGGSDTGDYSFHILPAFWNGDVNATWDSYFEPNPTQYNAVLLSLSNQPIYNYIDNANDIDFFRYTVSESNMYTLSLEQETGVGVELYVYDQFMNLLSSSSGVNSYSYSCAFGGSHYVKVVRDAGAVTGSYYLRLQATAVTYETDIAPESIILHTGNAPYKLKAWTSNSSSIVWSWNNASIATVDGNGNVTAQGIGVAKIRATSSNNSAKYSESTIFVNPPGDFEPNETFVTSTPIALNVTNAARIESTGDMDYYQFNVTAGCGYTAKIESTQGVSVTFYVYDQFQNRLSSVNGTTEFNYTCPTSSINYIRINRSGGTATGDYSFRILPAYWNGDVQANWDTYNEPNPTYYNAALLSLNNQPMFNYIDQSGDDDFFRYTVSEGNQYTLSLEQETGVNVIFYVYDRFMNRLSSVNGANTFSYSCPYTGTNFVQVVRNGGTEAGSYAIRLQATNVTYETDIAPVSMIIHNGDTPYKLKAWSSNSSGIVWSSSNSSIASVDGNGNVTAHNTGSAKIRAASSNNSAKYSENTIFVNPPGDFETNETFATSAPITLNVTNAARIESTGDIDYYQYNVVAGYGYTARVESTAGVSITFYVYDQLQNRLSSVNGTSQFNYTCYTSGINYIRIDRNGGTATGDYSFRILPAYWNSDVQANWDTYSEPNPTYYNAALLSLNNQPMFNYIDQSGDDDFFRYTVSEGNQYTLSLEQETGVNVIFYVYDQFLNRLSSVNGTSSFSYSCAYIGTHFVQVVRNGGTEAGSYAIRLQATNVTYETDIAPGFIILHPGDNPYKLKAWSSNSSSLIWSWSNPSIATVDGNGNVTAQGIGMAKIRATSANNSLKYSESTVFVNPTGDSEPNNTFATSTQVSVGTTIASKIESSSDEDYFKFNAVAGNGYTVRIESIYGISLTFYVYDQSQARLSSVNGTTQFNYACLTSGINYVRIVRNGGTATGYYSFTILPAYWNSDVTAKWDTYFEPNPTYYNSALLSVNGLSIFNYIDDVSDVDYFRYSVTSGHQYTASLEQETGIGVTMYVYDQAMNRLSSVNGTNSYSYTSSSTSTHYIQVVRNGGTASGSYRLSVLSQDETTPTILISPINNIVVNSSSIVFDWNDVIGAVDYHLIVDDNINFTDPEISWITSAYSNHQQSYCTVGTDWLFDSTYYWKVVAYSSNGDSLVSSDQSFQFNSLKNQTPNWKPILRSYKSADVDHFYCTDLNQMLVADSLYAFAYEKTEGFLADKPYTTSNSLKPVYRLYSLGSTATNEKSHYYTTDVSQRNTKIRSNWRYEGIIGYTEESSNFVPLYYLYKHGQNPIMKNDNFYTTSEFEKNNAVTNLGYDLIGIMCKVSLDGNASTMPWLENQAAIGQGINPANGNFSTYGKDLFSIPGGKMSLDFSYSYNSYNTKFLSQMNPIGIGWNHTYNSYIYVTATRLYVYWADGSIHIYNNSTPYNAITEGIYNKLQYINSTRYTIILKNQQVYTFDILVPSSNLAVLTQITDRNSNVLNLGYMSGTNRLDHVTDRFQRTLRFYYTTIETSDNTINYLISTVSDETGNRSINFGYDEYLNLLSCRDAMNNITAYVYDSIHFQEHLLIRVCLPNYHSIVNTYNSDKKIASQNYDVGGQSMNLNYGDVTTTVTDQNSVVSNYQYSNTILKNLQHITAPNVVMDYQYCDSNNPTLPTQISDGNGNTTTMTYDSNGNIKTVNRSGIALHQYNYNSTNDMIEYVDPLNHRTYLGYTNGNLTSVQTPRGTSNFQYSTYGKMTHSTNPTGQTTSYGYNQYDNVSTISKLLGLTTSYVYDNISRVQNVTNPLGQITSYQYNPNDNITSVTELGDVTSYTYDQNNNLLSVSKNGQTTTLQYNNLDLLYTTANPLGNTTYRYYNPNGSLQSMQKPTGTTINYSYNGTGEFSSMSSPSVSVNFGYDNNRNINSISDNNGSMIYHYDSLNRVTDVMSNYGVSNYVSYNYDAADNITSISYGGHTVTYTYDNDNLLHSVRDWNNRTTFFNYRSDGSLNSIQYPNGISCNYGYDIAGRLTSLSNTGINSYNYTLNALGFHTSVDQTEPISTFTLPETNLGYNYDNANRITTTGSSTFTHNANGDMTNRTNPQSTYNWDSLDRLTGISGASNISYTYDALGNRRSRTENGTTIRYVLDINSSMSNVLVETDNNGNAINYYIYANGMLISRIKPNGSTRFYQYDSRGSTIAMTNESGQITHKYAYDPYGKVISKQEEDSNPFRFVGGFGVMDEGNGLSYMRARYYDQVLGRFISEDPEWDTNLYTYCKNNPLSRIDPLGLSFWDDLKVVFSIIGGAFQLKAQGINSTASPSGSGAMETLGQGVLTLAEALKVINSFDKSIIATIESDPETVLEDGYNAAADYLVNMQPMTLSNISKKPKKEVEFYLRTKYPGYKD